MWIFGRVRKSFMFWLFDRISNTRSLFMLGVYKCLYFVFTLEPYKKFKAYVQSIKEIDGEIISHSEGE